MLFYMRQSGKPSCKLTTGQRPEGSNGVSQPDTVGRGSLRKRNHTCKAFMRELGEKEECKAVRVAVCSQERQRDETRERGGKRGIRPSIGPPIL